LSKLDRMRRPIALRDTFRPPSVRNGYEARRWRGGSPEMETRRYFCRR